MSVVKAQETAIKTFHGRNFEIDAYFKCSYNTLDDRAEVGFKLNPNLLGIQITITANRATLSFDDD